MSEISAAARRELVESVGVRYRSVSASGDKRRILDAFVAVPATIASMPSACSMPSMSGFAGGTADDIRCTTKPSGKR